MQPAGTVSACHTTLGDLGSAPKASSLFDSHRIFEKEWRQTMFSSFQLSGELGPGDSGFVADRHWAEAGGRGLGLKVVTGVRADNVGDIIFSPSRRSTVYGTGRRASFFPPRPISSFLFLFFYVFVIINTRSIKVRDNAKEVRSSQRKALPLCSAFPHLCPSWVHQRSGKIALAEINSEQMYGRSTKSVIILDILLLLQCLLNIYF